MEEGNQQDRLEIVIAAAAQDALSAIKAVTKGLENMNTVLNSVNKTLGTLGNTKSIRNVKKELDDTDASTKKLYDGITKVKKALSAGFNLGKLYLLWNVTKRIRSTIWGWIEASVDFIETTNKFEVAMGSMADKAYAFQNKLSNAFGTVTKEMMNYQATFKNIMSSLPGLTNEAAEQVSETLVKLGLDYSSLYNVDQSTAMSRIQAALVGSVKPIRSDAGYDITEATIGRKAQELGIETSVRNLNQMEKRLLRIIVLMDQMRSTGAMQDLARTIEQPANQIKVLKNQVQELGVWLGNVFIGTIGRILPYINGFVMALVAIIKTLAIFVGYTNTGKGLAEGLEVAENATDGIASGMGGAAKSAKELRKTLMGFDVLNVIQTPKDSSGGGGGGGGDLGAINPAILNALKDYDNLMNSVKMKATEIRDKIMDWLGFTKIINPLTGEISWELKEGHTRLKTILNVLKTIAGVILGLKIIGKLRNLITLLKTGTTTGLTPFKSGLVGIANAFKGLKTWFAIGIDNFKSLKAAGETTGAALSTTAKGMFDLIPTAVKATAGIAGLTASLYGAYNAMKDFSEGNKSSQDAFVQLGISIGGAAASGALLGSVIPGIGTALGAVLGALAGAAAAIGGFKTDTDKLVDSINASNDSVQKNIDSWYAMKDAVQDTVDSQLAEVEYNERLVGELDNLVDANGKVKTGYEDRVKFILNQLNEAYGTEYRLVNGQIQNYQELTDKIYEAIDAKKAEILLAANEAVYAEAIKQRTQAYMDYNQTQKNVSKSESELIAELKKHGLTLDDYTNKTAKYTTFISMNGNVLSGVSKKVIKLGDAYTSSKSKLKESEKVWKDVNETIISWEDLKTAVITGDSKAIEENLKTLTSTYETESGKQVATTIQKLQMEKDATEKTGKDTYSIAIQNLANTTKGVKELSDDQILAWAYLAQQDKEGYLKGLDGLDEDSRKIVEEAMNKIQNVMKIKLPGVEAAAQNINQAITKNMDGTFSINFALNANYSDLKERLKTMKRTLEKMSNVPIVGSAFKNYVSNIQRLIDTFAGGGFPDMGQLFVAREAGPELVGSIGSRNAVVNNDQIVEAVSTGVANAVSSVLGNGGSSYQLIIDGEQITDVVQRRLARKANITGMAMGV